MVINWLFALSAMSGWLLCTALAFAEGPAKDHDNDFSYSGFSAVSFDTATYGRFKRDNYFVNDNSVSAHYQTCSFSLYAYYEPMQAPPQAGIYQASASQALLDCKPYQESNWHGYLGRFQNFDRGDVRYLYGLNDDGLSIGNYDNFRRSPVYANAVANQDGFGIGYDIDKNTSVIARYTYTHLDVYIPGLAGTPTYSIRLKTKLFGFYQEAELAHIGAFRATQGAFSMRGEQPITDDFKLQATGILIVEQSPIGLTKAWQTALGGVGEAPLGFQWKTGTGFMGEMNDTVASYTFAGLSHKLIDEFRVSGIATRTFELSGTRSTMPSTSFMLTLSTKF